jgi:hypothetical protein
MRIFGRIPAKLNERAPARAPELEELQIAADPPTLRRLASLLQDVAAQMETDGSHFDHVHLLDAWDAHGTDVPDIIITRERDAA